MAKELSAANPLLGLNGNVTDEHVAELEAAIAAREKELVGLRQLHKVGLALLGKLPPGESIVWIDDMDHAVPAAAAGELLSVATEWSLPPDLWAIARRLLPRLAKKGVLTL